MSLTTSKHPTESSGYNSNLPDLVQVVGIIGEVLSSLTNPFLQAMCTTVLGNACASNKYSLGDNSTTWLFSGTFEKGQRVAVKYIK